MVKIQELLAYLQSQKIAYRFYGDKEAGIKGFSGLNRYKPGTMTWIKNAQKAAENQLLDEEITLAIGDVRIQDSNIKNQIIVQDSKRVFFSLMEKIAEAEVKEQTARKEREKKEEVEVKEIEKNKNHRGVQSPLATATIQETLEEQKKAVIGPNTYISKKVLLGRNVKIGANCVIDGNITIGDDTVIGNNVVILYKVHIGKNCVIQSGAVIGEEGFSYWEEDHQKTMVKHYGGVTIHDDVRVGANTCIVRGTIDDTVIGKGSKIDNLCHIAHNCQIGKNCVIIAGATLCGSVIVEDNAYISTAAVRQQLHVGEGALVGLGAVVVKDVETSTVVIGNPAKVMK